jgi:hypothetical protein
MTMTDFRALCTELVEAYEGCFLFACGTAPNDLIDRARTALTAEPQGDPVGELVTWVTVDGHRVRVRCTVMEPCPADKWRTVARAALAAEPQKLTNEELLARSNAALAQTQPPQGLVLPL